MTELGEVRVRSGEYRAAPPQRGERVWHYVLHPRDFVVTLGDYIRRVWVQSSEDNVFFLAGGVAFNILLAAVPFVLLIVTGLASVLNRRVAFASAEVWSFLQRLLPPMSDVTSRSLHDLLDSILKTRGSIGLWSAIGFIWFTTRLFGSLRTVLAEVFDIEHERGIVLGKLFDLRITIVATFLLVAYFVVSVYLALARTRGTALLEAFGLQQDVLSRFEYWSGRAIAFVFVVTAFYAVYRYLPNRKIRVQQALVGAMSTGVLFEIARNVYTLITQRFDPGSLYSGTLYAVISIVFWVYYAALVFIIGGEVAQVNELRRQLRVQRETFDQPSRPRATPRPA
ncbi:MAG: YihY/virulence factor BrkB family protein [Gemmatimonadaceae bacterium]